MFFLKSTHRAFKSFRLKKRSSTLGINKTSESPPTLRRQQLVHPAENHNGSASGYATMRHTINVGHQNPSANGSFIRGGYRSSLQNMSISGTVHIINKLINYLNANK